LKGMYQFPHLFQPGHIGKLETKNRLIMAPMAQMWGEIDGRFSRQQIDYYATRAKGGVGLIITESVFVERKISPTFDSPVTFMDSHYYVPRASELVQAVHDYGAKIGIQLTPGQGRNVIRPSKQRIPVSASAIPSFSDPGIICHELTQKEIKEIIEACGRAAELAVLAGFDLIEIHSYGGYLIEQFLTPLWNRRKDKYGGDIEGRTRFAVEIVKAMRAAAGPDVALAFRFSLEHGIKGGRNLAESQKIARIIEAAGVDILDCGVGCMETVHWVTPPNYISTERYADLASAIRKTVNIPVTIAGGITSPVRAEQILKEGKSDFISLGRPLIADPDWPAKAEKGQLEDIRQCLMCNEGCVGGALVNSRSLSCSVNVLVGQERYYAITRAEKPKKVMVVGGGPAGMEAARIAAIKGHSVTLFEKENELGGQLRAASQPAFKSALGSLIKNLRFQLDKLGVKVEMGKEVTPELVCSFKPEAVVVATGAKPGISSLPGAKSKKVFTAVDLLLGKRKAGDEVVVVGASLVGCDTALYLAQKGKKVSIIKVRPGNDIVLGINPENRTALMEQLTEFKVNFLFDLTIKEFTAEGISVVDKKEKPKIIKADTIVLAIGAKSDNKLAGDLKNKVSELYVVGDCVNPRKVGEAIHEGFVAGWRI
jgi:2-enoate reductase